MSLLCWYEHAGVDRATVIPNMEAAREGFWVGDGFVFAGAVGGNPKIWIPPGRVLYVEVEL